MKQSIIHVAIVVPDYDEAIDYYTRILGFDLIEDRYISAQQKRWVLVSPGTVNGTSLLLARAEDADQERCIGNQTGGRVFLFLGTDDFRRDYNRLAANGVKFVRGPEEHEYGTVAVFEDLYGNLWDLLEHREDHPCSLKK